MATFSPMHVATALRDFVLSEPEACLSATELARFYKTQPQGSRNINKRFVKQHGASLGLSWDDTVRPTGGIRVLAEDTEECKDEIVFVPAPPARHELRCPEPSCATSRTFGTPAALQMHIQKKHSEMQDRKPTAPDCVPDNADKGVQSTVSGGATVQRGYRCSDCGAEFEEWQQCLAHLRQSKHMDTSFGGIKDTQTRCRGGAQDGASAEAAPAAPPPRPAPAIPKPAQKAAPKAAKTNTRTTGVLSPDLAFFQQARLGVIERRGWLHFNELLGLLQDRYGHYKNKWPNSLREACNGVSRLLGGVNSCIEAALATHHVLSLHSLETEILMGLKDMQTVSHFSKLKLGSLLCCPRVEQAFRPSQTVLDAGEAHAISTSDVLEFLMRRRVGERENGAEGESAGPVPVEAELQLLAEERGLAHREDLCVFVRAESFVYYLRGMCSRADRHSRTNATNNMTAELTARWEQEDRGVQEDMVLHTRKWMAGIQSKLAGNDLFELLHIARTHAYAGILQRMHLGNRERTLAGVLASRVLAPVLVCALTSTELSAEAEPVFQLTKKSVLECVREQLAAAVADNSEGVLSVLRQVEVKYLKLIGEERQPSLLMYMHHHPELAVLLQSLPLGRAPELLHSAVPEHVALDNLCGVLAGLEAGGSIFTVLAAAEQELLQLCGVEGFSGLALPYDTFLQFCNQHCEALTERLGAFSLCTRHKNTPKHALSCLTASALLGVDPKIPEMEGREATVAELLASIQSAPCGADLEEWTLWQARWVDCFGGSFAEFMQQHVLCGSSAQQGVFAEVLDGRFVRFDSAVDCHERFKEALQAHDGASAGLWALGLLIEAGSLADLPVSLSRQLVFDSLLQMTASGAAMFTLQAAKSIPSRLRRALAAPIFVAPYLQAVGDAENLLQQACCSPEDVSVLRTVGDALGKGGWARTRSWGPSSLSKLANECPVSPKASSASTASHSVVRDAQVPAPSKTEAARPLPLQPGDSEDECLSVCQHIRQKFGLGLDFGSDIAKDAVNQLQGVTNRSIERLAADLYSAEIHFCLELIQNFDDNEYNQGVCPGVTITLEEGSIRFFCNERGFTEKNVIALSSIGESTKDATNPGYIGQKGIGFKSVFKISPKPQVHSRGYHFGYDVSAQDAGLGYIIPSPVSKPQWWEPNSHLAGTHIVLPLDCPGAASVAMCRSYVSDIHQSLLLFLHRLRFICFEDSTSESCTRAIRREDLPDGVVRVHEEKSGSDVKTHDWFVRRQMLQSPSALREGVSLTEVAVAIPLDNDIEPPPQCDVFAFLPLRSYGFSFVVQADWIVPSSREAVDCVHPWNQWIRSELPEVIARTFLELVSKASGLLFSAVSSNMQEGAALFNKIFRLLPLQAVEFFAPVPSNVLKRLTLHPLVPVVAGVCSTPEQAVLPPSPACAEVDSITQTVLAELGMSFVCPEVSIPAPVAERLGVQGMSAERILLAVTHAAASWQQSSDVPLRWLCHMLGMMQAQGNSAALLPQLKAISMIPLSDGSLGCFGTEPIIQLTGDNQEQQPKFLGSQTRILLSTCSDELAKQPEALTLLMRLGLTRTNTESFLRRYIVPGLNQLSNSNETLIEMLCYFKSQLRCQSKAGRQHLLSELQEKGVLLVDTSGLKVRAAKEAQLHFSPCFGGVLAPRCFRPELIEGLRWCCVSEAYMQLDADSVGWGELLQPLGVSGFVHLEELETPQLSWDQFVSRLDASQRAELQSEVGEVRVTSKDFHSPELSVILDACATTDDRAIPSQTLELLLLFWDTVELHPEWLSVTVQAAHREWEVPSSFLMLLRSSKWLVSGGPVEESTVHIPSSLCHPSAEVASDLQRSAFPVVCCRNIPAHFASIIGVKIGLGVGDILAGFAAWAREPGEQRGSVDTMVKVYRWLESNASSSEMQQLRQCQFVWVPSSKATKTTTSHVTGLGRLYSPSQCAWRDPAGLIDSTRSTVTPAMQRLAGSVGLRVLDSWYPKTACGMLERLGVPAEPSNEAYIQILKEASQGIAADNVATAFRILCHFGYSNQDDSDEEDLEHSQVQVLRTALRGKAIIPTMSKSKPWGCIEDVWFVADRDNECRACDDALAHTLSVRWDGVIDSKEVRKSSDKSCIVIKLLRHNLEQFADLFGLVPLSTAVRPHVVTSPDCSEAPAHAVLECCVLARLVQRWSRRCNDGEKHARVGAHLKQLRVFHASSVSRATLVQGDQQVIHEEGPLVDCILLQQAGCEPHLYLQRTSVSAAQLGSQFSMLVEQDLARLMQPFLVSALERLSYAVVPQDSEQIDRLVSDIAGQHCCAELDEAPWLAFDCQAQEPAVLLPSEPLPTLQEHRVLPLAAVPPASALDPALEAAIAGNRELQSRPRAEKPPSIRRSQPVGMPVSHVSEQTSRVAGEQPWCPSEGMQMPVKSGSDVWGTDKLERVIAQSEDETLSLMASEQDLLAIGRWGEQLVLAVLLHDPDTLSVEWVNQAQEVGRPYDLIVTRASGVHFVEVKTTSSLTQSTFPISMAELKCSEEHGGSYELFRVFGAGSAQVWIKRIPHLWASHFTLLCSLGEE